MPDKSSVYSTIWSYDISISQRPSYTALSDHWTFVMINIMMHIITADTPWLTAVASRSGIAIGQLYMKKERKYKWRRVDWYPKFFYSSTNHRKSKFLKCTQLYRSNTVSPLLCCNIWSDMPVCCFSPLVSPLLRCAHSKDTWRAAVSCGASTGYRCSSVSVWVSPLPYLL